MPNAKRKLASRPASLKVETPKFLTFGKPDIGDAEVDAVTQVLRSGWLSTGPVVRAFEEEFASYIGSGSAVAVSSATMGLMLSMAVACIGDGAEMITTPLTFAATVNAMLAMRVRPIFIDVDAHGNLDPNALENYLRQRSRDNHMIKGILPVHYCGASASMREIANLAKIYNMKVIEDAAHAFGGDYVAPAEGGEKLGRRSKIGTISEFTVFSLYPTKNITSAEGGMVVTKSAEYAERIRALSNQGMSAASWARYGAGPIRTYEVMHHGYKGNMSDVHAAIGLAQIRRWPEIQAKRSIIWETYEDAFGYKEPGHSQHLFTIQVKNRDKFRELMHREGIGTGIHFNPLHLEPGFHFLGYKRGDFPNAERLGDSTVSLPISSVMTKADALRVVEAVKRSKEEGNV